MHERICITHGYCSAVAWGKDDLLGICKWYTNLVKPNRVQNLEGLTHINEIGRVIEI